MNWDVIKGQWNQMKGEARKQWGKLTDDDWDQIAGERDKLFGRLQERYGWEKARVEREVDTFFGSSNSDFARGERTEARSDANPDFARGQDK
ncbi:CsbD family protein [Oscillochloris sp. ZM17-4]|nr:CsbD family protein [Oscillochloris sp. ZM17-4]